MQHKVWTCDVCGKEFRDDQDFANVIVCVDKEFNGVDYDNKCYTIDICAQCLGKRVEKYVKPMNFEMRKKFVAEFFPKEKGVTR